MDGFTTVNQRLVLKVMKLHVASFEVGDGYAGFIIMLMGIIERSRVDDCQMVEAAHHATVTMTVDDKTELVTAQHLMYSVPVL